MATENPKEKVDEAEALGIKRSKVKFSSFNGKGDPAKVDREEKRHNKFAAKRVENRVAKAKAEAKMKPIDKRLALLVGRLKAVKSRDRANTYSDKVVEAWTEEYKIIKNSPKTWNKITENGKIPFSPGNKRKKTAKQLLDQMNIEV